ncbi:MAG: serine protease, partial [Elusimicrobiota bacterium]|nr:serine protease [Elusimicrobiota bacterium]
GYAIKNDGDIVSVFNNALDVRNISTELLQSAKNNGGTKLYHFDNPFNGLYDKLGFKEYKREKWNDEYKPMNWDDKDGNPDVVYRRYEHNEKAAKMNGADVKPIEENPVSDGLTSQEFGSEYQKIPQEVLPQIYAAAPDDAASAAQKDWQLLSFEGNPGPAGPASRPNVSPDEAVFKVHSNNGFGSGWLVDHRGVKFFITAGHVTPEVGSKATFVNNSGFTVDGIVIDAVFGGGHDYAILLPLGDVSGITPFRISSNPAYLGQEVTTYSFPGGRGFLDEIHKIDEAGYLSFIFNDDYNNIQPGSSGGVVVDIKKKNMAYGLIAKHGIDHRGHIVEAYDILGVRKAFTGIFKGYLYNPEKREYLTKYFPFSNFKDSYPNIMRRLEWEKAAFKPAPNFIKAVPNILITEDEFRARGMDKPGWDLLSKGLDASENNKGVSGAMSGTSNPDNTYGNISVRDNIPNQGEHMEKIKDATFAIEPSGGTLVVVNPNDFSQSILDVFPFRMPADLLMGITVGHATEEGVSAVSSRNNKRFTPGKDFPLKVFFQNAPHIRGGDFAAMLLKGNFPYVKLGSEETSFKEFEPLMMIGYPFINNVPTLTRTDGLFFGKNKISGYKELNTVIGPEGDTPLIGHSGSGLYKIQENGGEPLIYGLFSQVDRRYVPHLSLMKSPTGQLIFPKTHFFDIGVYTPLSNIYKFLKQGFNLQNKIVREFFSSNYPGLINPAKSITIPNNPLSTDNVTPAK